MSEKQYITPQGMQKMKDELKNLISVERKKVVDDIEEARSHGDLKENAEYHAAKEKQGHIEGRIQYLNAIIADSEVIDPTSIDSEKVLFGATVVYEDTETGEETSWQIVGKEESDIKNNKISIDSPIARGLLNKEAGDTVVIKIPKGDIEVEITDVRYE